MFVNREREIERIGTALRRRKAQLLVIYGRRRCGKSTLIRHALPAGCIYFSADLSDTPLQIASLAREIGNEIPGFSNPVYPGWEALFTSFGQALKRRIVLCIDEFPYLVRNAPALPSILQKWVDTAGKNRKADIILCGSSQRMMYDIALNGSAPLYGRCDEIMKIKPMAAKYFRQYTAFDPENAVKEFAVWGGVPRYWEIRKNEKSFEAAVLKHVLDPFGLLYEEPERLFMDELRTATQAYSILELIGSGSHRISEIAGRLGKPASQLTRQLGLLQELGYVKRMVPFGEDFKSSKKGIYKIEDDFLRFYYAYITPSKSALELGHTVQVWKNIQASFDSFAAYTWENLCRQAIPTLTIEGMQFNPAHAWWGAGLDGKQYEIDIVAESTDKSTLLIGEAKWSNKQDHPRWMNKLKDTIPNLPFVKDRKVLPVLFTKKPYSNKGEIQGLVLSAADVM